MNRKNEMNDGMLEQVNGGLVAGMYLRNAVDVEVADVDESAVKADFTVDDIEVRGVVIPLAQLDLGVCATVVV